MRYRFSSYIWRFLLAFAPCFLIIYLAWIGAQYIIEDTVVFGAVDVCVTCALAWYAARDVLSIEEKLQRATKRAT